jgi:hypothetical protein
VPNQRNGTPHNDTCHEEKKDGNKIQNTTP